MDSLAKHGELNSGEIDAKMLVYKYKFLAKDNEYDSTQLDDYLELLHSGNGCHVNVYTEYASVYSSLFDERFNHEMEDLIIVQIRISKQLPLEASSSEFADSVSKGFEAISGIDGNSHWFEKKEGTESYVRLLNEIPANRRSTKI